MADGFEIKVEGVSEINQLMRQLGARVSTRLAVKALRIGARHLRDAAKEDAPRKTGKLKRNIVVANSRIYRAGKGRRTVGVVVKIRQKGKADNPQNAYYWRFQEDGWYPHGKRTTSVTARRTAALLTGSRRSGRRTAIGGPKVRAQRYIERSFNREKQTAARLAIDKGERLISDEARRQGLNSG